MDAQLRDFLPISQIGTWALLGPVGCCCPGPRQGIALGAPGPLPGIANRRALRCPLTRCGQCAWQQANGNLPKGAACLTWENVFRGGDGRGEPLTAWAVTGIRGVRCFGPLFFETAMGSIPSQTASSAAARTLEARARSFGMYVVV